ncbi:kinase-like domain-containing protein [Aspergillus bertholletiae]|uniref:Kinase-like domain-containing protein n=1 Tax=Aspergillus bertholletiae TaxID=1226010 RepID=A0A5N7B4B2_9EURO|nr:kinase-like domain-containing protein [Aspergillus bertholletiae]
MADEDIVQLFKLDIVVHGDRSRQKTFEPDPHHSDKRERVVTIWTRQGYLANNVYLEESPVGEQRVVKQIVPDKDNVARCFSELEFMGRLSRMTELRGDLLFVKFLGWFPSKDHVCFAMEYCQHGDISHCFPEPAAEQMVWTMCSQLMEGLSVLHELEITHRDIKPQNILVVQKEPLLVKIADFGISKRTMEGETSLRTRAGTKDYMAPEVHGLFDNTTESSSYTSAVDIWSLGCLLYYALTKQVPFPKYSDLHDYYWGLTPFPEALLRERGVSASGTEFIKGLLALSPDDRPKASIDLMSNWVVTATENVPVISRPQSRNDGATSRSSSDTAALSQNPPGQPTPPKKTTPVLSQVLIPTVSNVGQEDMDYYSYELWRLCKSPQSGVDQVRPLLESGASPNKLFEGHTALHHAAENGPAEIVRILLQYGADATLRTRPHLETAVHLITYQGDLETFSKKLQLLLDRGADINAQNADGDTGLHLAILRFGTTEPVTLLLDLGAIPEFVGRSGFTPLQYALSLNQERKATVLLQRGANPNAQDIHRRTPLHQAIASSKITLQFIERLLAAGADANLTDDENRSPLAEAHRKNRRDAIHLLINHGASSDLGDPALERQLQRAQSWWKLPWPFK